METVYRERANGRYEFWTYSDSQRVYISMVQAEKMQRQGARLVIVSEPRRALSRVINRAIAKGTPIYTNKDA